MLRCVHVSALVLASVPFLGFAQTTDPNPGHKPDVFLDNHRPLIQKKEKAPTSRVIIGKVVDDTGGPLEGALVTLTDVKSSERKQAITKADGHYSFEDLPFNADYELRAKWKTQTSEVRKVSQYDHSARAVRTLTIGEPPAEAKK